MNDQNEQLASPTVDAGGADASGADTGGADTGATFAALRRFTRQRNVADEECELCSAPIPPGHRHLLDMVSRRVACSCDACALRFHDVAGAKFKLIPRDSRSLPGFTMTDEQWENLAIPINLAFFTASSAGGRVVALYPGPAGVTESLLSFESWESLAAANHSLLEMQPDVEALIANRVGSSREYYLTPIDKCYELTGLIRIHWRGLSGGEEVWREIEGFFERLKRHAVPLQAPDHA